MNDLTNSVAATIHRSLCPYHACRHLPLLGDVEIAAAVLAVVGPNLAGEVRERLCAVPATDFAWRGKTARQSYIDGATDAAGIVEKLCGA